MICCDGKRLEGVGGGLGGDVSTSDFERIEGLRGFFPLPTGNFEAVVFRVVGSCWDADDRVRVSGTRRERGEDVSRVTIVQMHRRYRGMELAIAPQGSPDRPVC